MKRLKTLWLIVALSLPTAAIADDDTQTLRKSLVRIRATTQTPDYKQPWNAGKISGGVGSGFIISGNRIMTNAHVVSNARLLNVDKDSDPEHYTARVLHVAHDCDLAVLAVDDPKFFEGTIPLDIGGIPAMHSTVTAFGYPIGGERMSVTRGIVSRIEFQAYSHSSLDSHLAIQIDAAINPGNSGGPVIQGGKVVGVAFQGYSGAVAQSTGYMIPTPVISRFLEDIKDGAYNGYVELAVNTQSLQNPALRKALKLPPGNFGVLVTQVPQAGSGYGTIEVDDILLAIDGHEIKTDGHIELNDDYVQLEEIVERKFHGDTVSFDILRAGKPKKVDVTLKGAWPYRILASTYDVRPRFVLFAGMVFQPLNRNFLGTHKISDLEVMHHYAYFVGDEIYLERPEVVIFSSTLPDAINTYFEGYRHSVVDSVNGVKIRTLRDLAEALEKDVEHHVIHLLGKGRPVVIEAAQVPAATERISRQYRVTATSYLGEETDK
ncbi:MAG: S1-C subfamily serine protease [Rhodothermales bacterium]|jgi:S1-C subfamily serine protease